MKKYELQVLRGDLKRPQGKRHRETIKFEAEDLDNAWDRVKMELRLDSDEVAVDQFTEHGGICLVEDGQTIFPV